jgi:predicted lactoylglutathione lyase/plastocyanin
MKLFVNLPVRDLKRSIDFFTKLGFAFDARFTDPSATCMVLSDEAYVMLLTRERFADFTRRAISDATKQTEALFSVEVGSRAEVDAMVAAAISAGGSYAADNGARLHVRLELLRPRRPPLGGVLDGCVPDAAVGSLGGVPIGRCRPARADRRALRRAFLRACPERSRVVGRVSASAPGRWRSSSSHRPQPPADALAAVVVWQTRNGFEPELAVAAVGQPVLFVNRDEIFQAVFSYSEPNTFECRAFGPGETCMVTFREPGLVRTYSPLDAEPRGAVLVVPERHYAIPDARGRFRIDGVPAGRYRATLWSEQLGGASRELTLTAGETARADFTLAPR